MKLVPICIYHKKMHNSRRGSFVPLDESIIIKLFLENLEKKILNHFFFYYKNMNRRYV